MIFEGAKVEFIPSYNRWNKEGQTDAKAVIGKITHVNWLNRTFSVEFRCGETTQVEAFQFFDIGKSVKILG